MATDVDFFRINPVGRSQADAFEEFGCHIAAAAGEAPEGSVYERFRGGGGDGGVECLYTFPDGGKWGFQAKLVPIKGVKAQVEKSIGEALETHPTLRRYTILLPFDPTGRVARRAGVSESEKLNGYLVEWRQLARDRGMEVKFEFWYRSKILDRLLAMDPSGGRLRFWFGKEVLNPDWFARHAQRQVAALEPNYKPPLEPPRNALAALASLGCTPAWRGQMRYLRGWVRRGTWYVNQARHLGAPDAEELHGQLRELDALLQACETRPAREGLRRAEELAHGLQGRGSRLLEAWHPDPDAPTPPAQGLKVSLMPVYSALTTPAARMAGEPAMLLTGESGVGKTHTLCTEVDGRRKAGLPSVLLSGRGLAGEAWVRIRDVLGLPGSVGCDQMLAMLDAAGQAAGYPCVVFIDALNETEPRSHWQQQLPALAALLRPYEWLRLCVVCRTSYLQAVLGEWRGIARLEHGGIAGPAGYLAFFAEYGLEAPAMPPLGPEATNPGYLHLVCSAARAAGERRLPARRDGMADVIGAVLDGKNAGICARLDRSPYERLVHTAVQALARAMVAAGEQRLPFDEALRAVSAATDAPLGRALLDELVREDVLRVEDVQPLPGAPRAEVRFTFERMADHLRARELLAGLNGQAAVRAAFAPGGALHPLVADGDALTANQALVEALAVQLPETLGVELTEVAPEPVRAALLPAVLDSLLWRTPVSVGDAARAAATEALASPAWAGRALDVLFSIGVRPEHPLNADWLHERLAAFAMADRDVLLFELLQPWNDEGPVVRLLEWANDGMAKTDDAGRETARLAATLAAWACGASDRDLRDQATRALLALFRAQPIMTGVLDRFATVDDDQMAERHLAAAYACLLRDPVPERVAEVAAAVARRMGLPLRQHQGMRWYAKGIYALAGRAPHAGSTMEPARVPPPAAAPSTDDTALLGQVLRRPGLAAALANALRDAGSPLEPGRIRDMVAEEMWALGYTDARFGRRDRDVLSMGEDDDELEIGGPPAAKYLRMAVCRLIARFDDWASPFYHEVFAGDPRLLPPLPPRATRLVRETDLSIDGWALPEVGADAWWMPRDSAFWAAARPRVLQGGDTWPGAGMPAPLDAVTAVEPGAGRDWVVLFGTRGWNLEVPEAEIEWGRRMVTLTVRGYLVRREDRDAVDARLRRGGWALSLPPEAEWRALWVGEYPWRASAGLRVDGRPEDEPAAAGPLHPTVEPRVSAGPRPRYDDRMVPLPAAPFLEKRNPLSWHADGTYRQGDGSLALRHPDATLSGPPALLAAPEYLRAFLRRQKMELLWVVEMEDVAVPYDTPGRGELRAHMAWALRRERGRATVVATDAWPAAGGADAADRPG